MTDLPASDPLQNKLQSLLQHLRAKGVNRALIMETTRSLLLQKKHALAGGHTARIACDSVTEPPYAEARASLHSDDPHDKS